MESNQPHIRFHAAFEMMLDELVAVVAKEKERNPGSYKKSPRAQLLARIYRAITHDIPADPRYPGYYQGETEGYSYKQWKRAKPAEQHRLFFKYDKANNAILYAWFNSEVTLAKYRSHLDAYRAFRKKK